MTGDPPWLDEIDTAAVRLADAPIMDKAALAGRLFGHLRNALLDLHGRLRALEGSRHDGAH